MPKKHRPRKGSLQFWPRKRAAKILPSGNWKAIAASQKEGEREGLLGFVGYKVGMTTASVQDLTPNSMTINEQIVLPATIIECPPMKVFSIRLYKGDKTETEMLAEHIDKEKELKRKVKLPKQVKKKEANLDGITDVRVLCYTQPKLAKIKKKPDICEIGIKAENVEKKFEIAKSLIGKEINIADVFSALELIDIRAVTKGKGYSGTVKRFGIGLKQKKGEKGQRRPGSLGPWTPSKVGFRAPMAGQLGFFSRVQYNNQILLAGGREEASGLSFNGYGIIRNPFLVVKGSLQGSRKRPLLITTPLRKKRRLGNYKFTKFVR